MPYFVGVDLGASNVRAAVADANGEVLATAMTPTPRGPTGIAVTEAVLETVRTACGSASVAPGRIRAAGIGSIGPLDLAAGTVENPANLPNEIDTIPLVGPLSELLGSERVFLHNDTVAGVIGERFYSDRNPDDMVYLTISTGIGAGVAVDGNIVSGWDGNAGEVGHMIVDPDGQRVCGCGRAGHWEAYCSGNNIPEYARDLAAEQDLVTDVQLEDDDLTAADIYDAAGTDELADVVIERTAEWNAIGLTNVIHAFAPLVIYVGGAVTINNPDLVLNPVRERLQDLVFTNVPELSLTTMGEEVVLRGAVASALTGGTGDRARIAAEQ